MQDKNTRSVIVVWFTLSIGVAGLLMTSHAVPRAEAADASPRTPVVFPTPPFWFTTATVTM